jgi:hypothetical protein
MMQLVKLALLSVPALLLGCYVQPYPGSVTIGPGGIGINPAVVDVAGPQVAVAAPAVGYEGGEPETVVVPGTSVYVAPGLAEDVYFTDGYWWRNFGGGWYRSTCYGCGWVAYGGAPYWYGGVHNWRYGYTNHYWNGHAWNERAQVHGHAAGVHGNQVFHNQQTQVQHGQQMQRGQNQMEHNQQIPHGQQPHVSQASQVTTQPQPHKKKQSN